MIGMIIKKLAASRPQLAITLLRHKDIHVKVFFLSRLPYEQALRRKELITELLAMLPEKNPWDSLPGGTPGGRSEDYLAQTLPIAAVEVLSMWREQGAVGYIRRLADDTHYQYRAGSIRLMTRYGVQESVPLCIHLLADKQGYVRGEAFYGLMRLAGITLGQKVDFWKDENLQAEAKSGAVKKWESWWEANGKGKDDAAFHAAVVDRAFELIEKHGWGDKNPDGISPDWLIREHVDLSPFREGADKEHAAALRRFWNENRSKMRFAAERQLFVLPE
jgi:hypothetical protein